MTFHKKPPEDLVQAIFDDPDISVSLRDAEKLAACLRLAAGPQPIMIDGEGKHRGQHWPTRCYGLACQVAKLKERIAELEQSAQSPVARLVDKHIKRTDK